MKLRVQAVPRPKLGVHYVLIFLYKWAWASGSPKLYPPAKKSISSSSSTWVSSGLATPSAMNWPPQPPYQGAVVPPPMPSTDPSSVDPHPPSSFPSTQNVPHFPPTAQPQYSIQAGVTPSYTQFHSGDNGLPLSGANSVDWYRSMPLAYSGVASSSTQGQYDLNSTSVAALNGFQGYNLTAHPPQGMAMASYIASAEFTTTAVAATTWSRNQLAKGHINKHPKKPKKPKVLQSAFCELCKIVCCSQDDLQRHRLGKKHKKNQEKSSQSSVAQSEFCEICSISCSGQESLQAHRLGKKHQKNLEQVNGVGKGEIESAPIIGPPENPNKQIITACKKNKANSQNVEDVEAKRRRVLEGGAAADSVMVCSVCNVVCNSDIVFSDHLAGKFHAATLKKLAVKALFQGS